MIIKKINDDVYIFGCPKCNWIGHIDREQAEGKVSVMHTTETNCDFHETKNWLKKFKLNN